MRGNLSERTARDFTTSNCLIYLVNWPKPGFYKLGFAVDQRRWRGYCASRGGQLIDVLAPATEHASIVEDRMHTLLRATGAVPAFASKADAVPHLGNRGSGWTECYAGDPTPAVRLFADYRAR